MNAYRDPIAPNDRHEAFSPASGHIVAQKLGRRAYEPVWRSMQDFTEHRTPETPDELWILEHEPVYTLGLNGKAEHILNAGNIPVVPVDRGGQVTYHGPGQVIAYPLLDLKRRRLGIRRLVTLLETAAIDLLSDYAVVGYAKPEAPGVYVADAKIASLGLRVRRGCTYHGLSFNASMDLTPFQGINPCGYAGLDVIHLDALVPGVTPAAAADGLMRHLVRLLNEHPAS